MLEAFLAEFSAFILNLTLEQELLLGSAAILSSCLALLRLRSKPTFSSSPEVDEQNVEQADLEIHAQATKDFSSGLVKSRSFLLSRLANWISSNKNIDHQNSSLLEEILIGADIGVQTSQALVAAVLAQTSTSAELMPALKNHLVRILKSDKNPEINLTLHRPMIILVVGVNGAGKTTTIAKISKLFKSQGKKVLVAAADTFRAAAVGQLEHWANRIGVDIEFKEGDNIKPATVVFDAIARLKKEQQDVLIIDTAGRLHNRVNLMNELEGINKSIKKEFPDAPHETLLVIDGSSGQNALQQAREFNQRVPLTGLVITKLDGTSKGGIVIAIRDELKIDIRYLGLGEGEDDLRLFSSEEFVEALLGDGRIENVVLDNVSSEDSSPDEEENCDIEPVVIERKVVRKRKEVTI